MPDFETPENDVHKYQVQDGSRDEALLKTLNNIVINTGGDSLNGGNVNKFGFNNDIDTAAAELIAAQGGSIAIMKTAGTLDVVSSSVEDDTGGTGASYILISGINENNVAINEYVTMDGQTPVTTTNTFLGVNRAVVITSGSNEANVGDITIDDTANSVGIQAYIPAGLSVTQQCVYHTPISRTLALEFLNISAIKISGGGGNPVVNIKGWSYSRVTDTNYNVIDFEIDLGVENNIVIPYSNPILFTGREVIYFTASTDVNNTKLSLRFSGAETDS